MEEQKEGRKERKEGRKEERKEERLGKRKVETRKKESQCYLLVTVV